MKCIDRLQEYEETDLDQIILLIRNGTIKSGKYAHLVKIDKDKKMNGKELFADGKNSDEP